MIRKYKFYNKEGLYSISFATVYWIDVFVQAEYFSILTESLDYCRKHKGLEIYCWCIMPSHVHLIIRAQEGNPEVVVGRFKEYTSKKLQGCILDNNQESRKEWMLWIACPNENGDLKGLAQKVVKLKENNFGSIIISS